MRKIYSLTVFESCRPYRKLVGGTNARKSIGICREDSLGHQDRRGDSRYPKELILAPSADL